MCINNLYNNHTPSIEATIKCENKTNQVFFILATQQPLVNRKDFKAPTLSGPTQLYQGPGPP